MHGVTPESVQRELMDAGFQVERTEKGNRRAFMVVAVRGHADPCPRLRSRPHDSGVLRDHSGVVPPLRSSRPTIPESSRHDSGVVSTPLRSRSDTTPESVELSATSAVFCLQCRLWDTAARRAWLNGCSGG